MTPHKYVTPEIDPGVLAQVCAALELSRPVSIKIRHRPQTTFHGTRDRKTHLIALECGLLEYQKATPGENRRQICITLLHELRHAHQHEHWTPERIAASDSQPYELREMEIDADSWAEANFEEFKRLVRIKSRFSQTPLGCVERAVASARQTV